MIPVQVKFNYRTFSSASANQAELQCFTCEEIVRCYKQLLAKTNRSVVRPTQ